MEISKPESASARDECRAVAHVHGWFRRWWHRTRGIDKAPKPSSANVQEPLGNTQRDMVRSIMESARNAMQLFRVSDLRVAGMQAYHQSVVSITNGDASARDLDEGVSGDRSERASSAGDRNGQRVIMERDQMPTEAMGHMLRIAREGPSSGEVLLRRSVWKGAGGLELATEWQTYGRGVAGYNRRQPSADQLVAAGHCVSASFCVFLGMMRTRLEVTPRAEQTRFKRV